MVIFSFSIHTAVPDELSAGGDDGVSFIFHFHTAGPDEFFAGGGRG
jgi:hypothetical protein